MINEEIEDSIENKLDNEQLFNMKEIKYLLNNHINANFYDDIVIEVLNKSILKHIDKLENKVKELEKENDKLTYARNWYFEITVNKLVTPEMLHKILRTKYIGREKIENKIAELDKEEKEIYKKDIGNNELYRLKIIDEIRSVLQELLEEK